MDGLKIRQHPTCQQGTADVLAFTVSEVFEHLRVYLCPSTVAGIHTKLVLVGNGSRELALTLQKLPRVPCTIVASSFLALSQRFQQSSKELTTAPSKEFRVGAIPSYVRFGRIQLVWHLA